MSSSHGRAHGRRRTHKPPHGTPKEEDDNPYFASVGIAAATPSSPPLPLPRPASPSRQSPSRQSPARQSPARQSPARLSPRQLRNGGGSGPAKPPTSRARLLKEAEAEQHGSAPARLLRLRLLRLRLLGSCASSAPAPPQAAPGGSWRLGTPRREAGPLSAQPLLRVLELATSRAANSTACGHPGGGGARGGRAGGRAGPREKGGREAASAQVAARAGRVRARVGVRLRLLGLRQRVMQA